MIETNAMLPITAWNQLATYSGGFWRVLALGIFDWSNYSQITLSRLHDAAPRFADKLIGLATFQLGEPHDVARICPGFLRHFLNAVDEPASLLVERGTLIGIRVGRTTAEDCLAWAMSPQPFLPEVTLAGHPHPELIGPSLEHAMNDHDPEVRTVASEVLRELNWSLGPYSARSKQDRTLCS